MKIPFWGSAYFQGLCMLVLGWVMADCNPDITG